MRPRSCWWPRLVPFTLVAPFAGAFVDRWSRRKVMIATDLARALIALLVLFVSRAEDLWIAYLCTVLLSLFGAFFEAAKNAAVPNITGDRDLLAGNALMWSSRFLLMSFGAAMGGWTAAHFGYRAAFIVNSISFLISAYSVWLIPDRAIRPSDAGEPSCGSRRAPQLLVRHPGGLDLYRKSCSSRHDSGDQYSLGHRWWRHQSNL